jgi:hypothetical protein
MHVTYSYFLNHLPQDTPNKAIKHAAFNLPWIQAAGSRLAEKSSLIISLNRGAPGHLITERPRPMP